MTNLSVRTKWLTIVSLAMLAFLLLTPLPKAWSAPWRAKILDLGHLPLFACITIVLYEGLGRSWLKAIVVASSLAAVGEIAQTATTRNGDFDDFLRGAIGSLLALLCYLLVKRQQSLRERLGALLTIFIVLVWPVLEAYPVLRDAYDNYQAFPALTDFESPRWLERWWYRQATIQRVYDPKLNQWVGEVIFEPGHDEEPAVTLRAHSDDWTISPYYQSLMVDFTAPAEGVTLGISIWDRRKSNKREDRFIEIQKWPAGRFQWRVSFDSVQQTKNLDLSQIHQVDIFTTKPITPTKIVIHKIWLSNPR